MLVFRNPQTPKSSSVVESYLSNRLVVLLPRFPSDSDKRLKKSARQGGATQYREKRFGHKTVHDPCTTKGVSA